MAVATPDNVDRFLEICAKWDVEATVVGEVTDGVMQTFAANVADLLAGKRAPASETPAPEGAAPAPEPATAAPDQSLDAWGLVVRPMLQRHAGQIATVAFAGVAAYVGARMGARRR